MPDKFRIIAALEDNHQGQLETAKRMVDAAARAGVDEIKVVARNLQASYTSELLERPYREFPERGSTIGEVLASFELDPAALAALREHARGRVGFVAAPYDLESFKALAALKPDAWQLDQGILGDQALVAAVALQKVRTYAVAALVTQSDIDRAAAAFAPGTLELLHAVMSPSAGIEETSLGLIPDLARAVGLPVGYLALDAGAQSALAAAGLGARTIEVPFTLERALRGPSHMASLDREGLERLCMTLRALQTSLAARGPRRLLPVEVDAYAEMRRGLVAAKDLPAGTTLTEDLLLTKSPGRGLSPRLLPRLVGKKLLYDLPADKPLTFGDVKL